MAVANKIAETLRETATEGFRRIDLTYTYEVIATYRNDSAFTAKSAQGIPALFSKFVTLSGETIWVVDINARRAGSPDTERKWHVDVSLTNATQEFPRDAGGNPVSNPVDAVKDVDITYLEFQEDISKSVLKSITSGGNNLPVPAWLQGRANTLGPIVNSAGVNQNVQKPAFRKLITVSQWVSSWTSYDAWLGKINSDSITIEQGDSSGTKLSETFAPGTLLMMDVIKEDHWKDGLLYFRRRIVLSYNPETWDYSQLDEGMDRRVFVDQFKPDGTKYDADDLIALGIEGDWDLIPITRDNGQVAIAEPIPFNGHGAEIPTQQTSGYDVDVPVYLNYLIFKTRAFAGLGL